jgi:uncharacterized protein
LETSLLEDELKSQVTPVLSPAWHWWDIVKALLLIFAGVILTGVTIAGFGLATGNDFSHADKLSSAPLFIAATGIYGFVVLAVYLFAVRRAGGSWAAVGLNSFSWRWLAMAPLLTILEFVGIAFINTQLIWRFTGEPFENPQIETITGGMRLTKLDLFLLLVLVAIIAPVAEELFFRGMLYPLLRKRWGVVLAVVTSALIFGFVHLIPVLIPGLVFVGLILGWVRQRSNSIVPGMIIHALQNGIVMLGIYFITNR